MSAVEEPPLDPVIALPLAERFGLAWRAWMADAEQWFMALKKQGIPVEFVRYPRSNHDLSRTGEPWLLVDRLGRLRQWFAHWLKP